MHSSMHGWFFLHCRLSCSRCLLRLPKRSITHISDLLIKMFYLFINKTDTENNLGAGVEDGAERCCFQKSFELGASRSVACSLRKFLTSDQFEMGKGMLPLELFPSFWHSKSAGTQ